MIRFESDILYTENSLDVIHSRDAENANIVEQIAQLESFIHIAVNVSVDEETAEIIDQQEVTIVGAKLNAAENQKENITLVIGKPEGDATLHIPDGYELNNILQFSMILQNVANTDALRVPVKISLPVPENMNPEQVVILHYNGDGTVREVIEPDVCKNGERYSANFVLASFCNFAMIERHKHVYESVVTDPNCMGNGYTTHTCRCGDSYVDSYVDALGHKYSAVVTPPTATEKGYTTHTCTRCGDSYVDAYVDPLPELPKAEIGFSQMILGNELAMQYAFKQAEIDPDTDYVVSITKTYADGRDDKVILVPESQWKTANVSGEPYYYVSFNGIAAKEMGDLIHVQVMTVDGDPAGEVFTTSVSKYALDQLRKTNVAATRTLYVDMLNYGAAAQTYFGYGAGNLVNASLTAAERGYATKTVNLENRLVKGPGYSASQLNLASSIQLRVRFSNIDSSMYAVIRFTNHTGRQIESRVEGSAFLYSGTVVVIDNVVAADYNRDVTVTVYNSQGKEVAKAVESVASYLARQTDKADAPVIYDAVAKYCESAYAYLHK